MMNHLPALAICTAALACAATPVFAADTITVPQEFALQRVIEVDVTPMGLVIDLGAPVKSVNLSHLSDVVFVGLDGVLCDAKAECTEATRPTKLLLRRIPPITFKHQLPSSDGTRMLFVDTDSGLYRFQIKPSSATAPYTEVEIQSGFPASARQFPLTR